MATILQGTCVYCGKENALSEVAVLPQYLFPHGWSGEIPTVSACPSCTMEEKAADATSLSDLLHLAMESSKYPTAQQLYEQFALAVGQSQLTLTHDALQSEGLPGFTSSGIMVGWAHGTERPSGQMVTALSRMVRGLYHTYTGGILPEETGFQVYRLRDATQIEMSAYLLLHLGGQYVRIGNGEVFECVYATGREQPALSRWLLFFYQRVIFSVATSIRSSK